MMSVEELRAGMVGSWKLLRGDAQGLRYFDQSIDGFWRSFGVMVLMIVPMLAVILTKRELIILGGADARSFPEVLFLTAQFVSFAVAWCLFPAVLAAFAGPLGVAGRFVPYVVARNWTSLIGIAPYFLGSILFLAGLMSVRLLSFITLGALLFNLYYGYVVARIAAAAPPGLAAALVALDVVLTLLVSAVADQVVQL